MKATILLITLIMTQVTNAERICEAYIFNEWPDSRYTVDTISGDNVVTDNKTGLMWKRCSEGLSGADCSVGTLTIHTWQQALELADTLDYAGFTNWQVPNQKELRTIVARNCYRPSVNEIIFPNTPSDWFWSSTPFIGSHSLAWSFNFDFGNLDFKDRTINYHVRLVRSPEQ